MRDHQLLMGGVLIGMGVLAFVGGLIFVVTPLGQDIPDYGVFGALDLPAWCLGLASMVAGAGFVYGGVQTRRKASSPLDDPEETK